MSYTAIWKQHRKAIFLTLTQQRNCTGTAISNELKSSPLERDLYGNEWLIWRANPYEHDNIWTEAAKTEQLTFSGFEFQFYGYG